MVNEYGLDEHGFRIGHSPQPLPEFPNLLPVHEELPDFGPIITRSACSYCGVSVSHRHMVVIMSSDLEPGQGI